MPTAFPSAPSKSNPIEELEFTCGETPVPDMVVALSAAFSWWQGHPFKPVLEEIRGSISHLKLVPP